MLGRAHLAAELVRRRQPGRQDRRRRGGPFRAQRQGRMGGERVTVQRLTVVRVDADRNLILIKGAIPGPKKSFVVIKNTVKPGKN